MAKMTTGRRCNSPDRRQWKQRDKRLIEQPSRKPGAKRIDAQALLDQVEIRVPQPGLQEFHVADVPKPPPSAPGVIGHLREPSRED